MYVLNIPGYEVYTNTMIWGWSIVLWTVGGLQVYALMKCTSRSWVGADCSECPFQEACKIPTLRRWAAGLSAIVWAALGCTFYSGHYFGIGTPTACIVTISQFLVFTMMSKR